MLQRWRGKPQRVLKSQSIFNGDNRRFIRGLEMDNVFEIIGKIATAVGGVGVIIIALASILSKIGVERLTSRLSKKDSISHEHRIKKDKALEELLSEFNMLYNSGTSIAKSKLILVPKHKCLARKYSKHFIPMSYEFLENVDKLIEYRESITGIISNNQFWFSDKLTTIFNYYVSYLYNVQYLYMLEIIKPSKLCAFFLSMDLHTMQSQISREVRNCYFGKHKTKYKSISNEKYWDKMNKSSKDFSLASLMMMFAGEEQRKEFKYIKYEKSNFYKHYKLCVSCEIDCPLAKKDFIYSDAKTEG